MKKHFRRSKKKGTLSSAQDFLHQRPLFPAQLFSSAPQTFLGSYAMPRTPSSFGRGSKPATAEPRPAPWSSCDALHGCMPVLLHNVPRGYSLCLSLLHPLDRHPWESKVRVTYTVSGYEQTPTLESSLLFSQIIGNHQAWRLLIPSLTSL